MPFLVVDGKEVPIDEAALDYLLSPPSESDDEVTAAAPKAVPKAAPKTAKETASRWKRVTRPKAREAITAEVQAEQRRLIAGGRHIVVTPPCMWCGLPTGCFCDQCRKPVCTVCDKALGQCVECCCKNMKCTEGQARQHAALVLKEFLPNSEDVGANVYPAFRELSFQEQARICLESGIPIDPHAQLQRRRQELREPETRPRQLTAEEAARLEEARRQRAQAAAAQQEAQRQRAIQKAQEEAKLVAQIDAQNTLASAARKDRRKGAGSAPSQPSHPAEEVEGAIVEVEEAELSKAQKRRERQRANRAAAAQRKDLQREKIAKEQFLRETAQGFTERQMPLEPTEPKCKERKSKPTQAKDFAENELAEDLLIGLWQAKLRDPGRDMSAGSADQ